ncbi:MAG: hypothetical protein IT271_11310 [Chitinophagales bacterium]|nr:hypothetical protein [Chitinophagales bacterium]
MSQRLLYLLLLLPLSIFAKPKQASIDCNTIFVCIDSLSYATLFDHPFIMDTLFICREQQTTTSNDTYTGKYAIGKAATLEFFKPVPTSEKNGDKPGDAGIEFKTRKLNNLATYTQQATNKKLTVLTDTTKTDTAENKFINWYRTLEIKDSVSSAAFSISLLEYDKEYLTFLGFTDMEIQSEMTYEQFNTLLSGGKKYPKAFNAIESVSVLLNKEELHYLKQNALLMGRRVKRGKITGNHFSINYKLKDNALFHVSAIRLSLTQPFPSRTISISSHLKLKIDGDTAVLEFE